MEHDQQSSISNSGNLITQSSPFASEIFDDDVQGPGKKLSSSSSSSSSLDSPLDDPFGEEDTETGNKNSEHHTMQTSPPNDGVDFQALSKKSVSSSSTSSLDKEELRDNSVGSMQMQPSLAVDGVDDQGLSKLSRSSSLSSSSSSDSLFEGNFGFDEDPRYKDSMQFFPSTLDEDDHQDYQKNSRSSISSSSPRSPLNGSHRNTDFENLMIQSSPGFEKVDAQSLRQVSRSSTVYSSPKASLNSSYKNADFGNLMIQSSPGVEKVDVQSPRKISRSSSSSSSKNSPLNGPSGEGNEKSRDINMGNLTMKSSSSKDSPLSGPFREGNEETGNTSIGNSPLTQAQAPSKISRSSSSSSSSSDSPRENPIGDKSVTSGTDLPELDHKAAVEDGEHDGPASRNSPPKNELPVAVTEVTNHHSESNLGNMSTTDSPPTQVMERTTKPKDRIPSRVFTRNKSNNPVDWSVASNESLFSIHMGNMSFTRDQLILPGESSIASGQMVNHSANPSPGEASTPGPGHMLNNSSDQNPGNKATNGESQESEKAEAAVETKEKVTSENESDKKSTVEGETHHHPAESAVSNKSFAFPILTDGEKRPSTSTHDSSISGTEQQRTESQKVSTPKTPPSEEKSEEPEPKSAVGAQFGFRLPWLSCLPCCT